MVCQCFFADAQKKLSELCQHCEQKSGATAARFTCGLAGSGYNSPHSA
jgi:hypothetical protein